MNKDFRVSVTFTRHPKVRRLRTRIGEGAVQHLLELMTFAALNKPEGQFTNMTAEDIADAAGWPVLATSKEFVDAVHAVGILDCGERCKNGWRRELHPNDLLLSRLAEDQRMGC